MMSVQFVTGAHRTSYVSYDAFWFLYTTPGIDVVYERGLSNEVKRSIYVREIKAIKIQVP